MLDTPKECVGISKGNDTTLLQQQLNNKCKFNDMDIDSVSEVERWALNHHFSKKLREFLKNNQLHTLDDLLRVIDDLKTHVVCENLGEKSSFMHALDKLEDEVDECSHDGDIDLYPSSLRPHEHPVFSEVPSNPALPLWNDQGNYCPPQLDEIIQAFGIPYMSYKSLSVSALDESGCIPNYNGSFGEGKVVIVKHQGIAKSSKTAYEEQLLKTKKLFDKAFQSLRKLAPLHTSYVANSYNVARLEFNAVTEQQSKLRQQHALENRVGKKRKDLEELKDVQRQEDAQLALESISKRQKLLK